MQADFSKASRKRETACIRGCRSREAERSWVGNCLLVYLYNGESVDIVAALHGRMAYQVPDPNDDAEP